QKYRLLLQQRGRSAVEHAHAAASVGPEAPAGGRRGGAGAAPGQGTAAGGRGAAAAPDFTTVERLDKLVPPAIRAKDAFLEFLFSRAPVKYDELKRKAQARDPLPTFRLDAVTLTFDVDTEYEIVRTQLTQNIVGIVEGSDPVLKHTYVALGAHYDHVGYADGEM